MNSVVDEKKRGSYGVRGRQKDEEYARLRG